MEIKTILFWLLLLAFVIPCYYFGFTKVIAQRQLSENFRRWKYSMRLSAFTWPCLRPSSFSFKNSTNFFLLTQGCQ